MTFRLKSKTFCTGVLFASLLIDLLSDNTKKEEIKNKLTKERKLKENFFSKEKKFKRKTFYREL